MSVIRIAAFRPSVAMERRDDQSTVPPPRSHQRPARGPRTAADRKREHRAKRQTRPSRRVGLGTIEANERREREKDAWFEQRHDEWMARLDRLRAWRQATGSEHATPKQMREIGL